MTPAAQQIARMTEGIRSAPLDGRVAFVTGGARGIGRAITLALAEAGASVAVGFRRDGDAAERLAQQAGAGGAHVTLHQGDVGAAGSCGHLVEEVLTSHGRIDLLVNNAGITADGSAVRLDDAAWEEVLAVNLTAAFRLARLVLPGMIDAGGGRIVSIASVIGERGNIGQANYAAAKAGLVGLTKTLARETAFALSRRPGPPEPRGLTVNAVAPGFIATDMLATVPDRVLERMVGEIPLGRLGEPEEVARVVRFLCEDESSYVTRADVERQRRDDDVMATPETATTTVPAALAARAAEWPDELATAVIGGGRLTFGAWERRSNAAARGLVGHGVRPLDRVLLPCDAADWIELAIAYAAVHKAGATAVPVSMRLGAHHIAWAAEASRAVGAVGADAATPPRGWTATVEQLEHARSSDPLPPRAHARDAAEILYTSGTTGRPKGVVATHASVLFAHSQHPPRPQRRLVLHPLTPGTTAGQGLLVQPLSPTPHTILTLPSYDDAALVAAIERERPTDLVLVPALALSLIRSQAAAAADLSSVRMVRTTSAPIAPAALARLDALFANASVYNMYASTESWPARTRMRFDPARPGSVGRADGGSAIRVADERGSALPPGRSATCS